MSSTQVVQTCYALLWQAAAWHEFAHTVQRRSQRAGTNAKRAPGKDEVDYHPRPTKFHALLGRLLPAALRLAAGAEPVARKLFGELVPQLVHWLTRSARTCASRVLVL